MKINFTIWHLIMALIVALLGYTFFEIAETIVFRSANIFLPENMIYAELSGDFPLGDSRQPTYKSLRPFDLVS